MQTSQAYLVFQSAGADTADRQERRGCGQKWLVLRLQPVVKPSFLVTYSLCRVATMLIGHRSQTIELIEPIHNVTHCLDLMDT